MPPEKQSKMRINCLPKDYKFLEFLTLSLNSPNPRLDYFNFANNFRGTKQAINNHYLDLLTKLSTNQSNKLLKIATDAKSVFDMREDNCDFGEKYKEYWEKRSENSLRRTMEKENRQTVTRLNRLTNKNIRALAEKAYHSNEDSEDVDDDLEDDNNVDDESGKNKPEDDEDVDNGSDENESEGSGTNNALKQMSNLVSDKVGYLNIIDLSSESAVQILKSEIPVETFNQITTVTSIESITLSEYASQLLNAFERSPLSLPVLRETLYENGFKRDFDFIQHSDVGFIEVTTRHFLDLMSSPNNSLNQNILERTAATYFIIFIVNQLFMPDNDVVELGWLEREFFASQKSKWDGVLFKVGTKSCSAGLIEFSGGCNDRTPNSKNQRDITKLYSKLLQIINTQSSSSKQTFCMRYYKNSIYFEKLTGYNNSMFRTTHAKIQVPNSPRKLVEYVQEIPRILAWKQAVVKHTLKV